jgi:dTDP-4-amino-4,6-dideoxygalactose transaminase
LTTQAKDNAVEYIHHEIGFNYRLTNIQAAMGCAQMEKLDEYISAKRQIAAEYSRCLAGVPGIVGMSEAPWARSIYWLYTILVDGSKAGLDSRRLMQLLARQRIQTRPLWQPMHRSPAHEGALAVGGAIADRLSRDGLSLPSSAGLDSVLVQQVCDVLRQAIL